MADGQHELSDMAANVIEFTSFTRIQRGGGALHIICIDSGVTTANCTRSGVCIVVSYCLFTVSYKITVIKKMEAMSPILLIPTIFLMLMLTISKAFGIKRRLMSPRGILLHSQG